MRNMFGGDLLFFYVEIFSRRAEPDRGSACRILASTVIGGTLVGLGRCKAMVERRDA